MAQRSRNISCEWPSDLDGSCTCSSHLLTNQHPRALCSKAVPKVVPRPLLRALAVTLSCRLTPIRHTQTSSVVPLWRSKVLRVSRMRSLCIMVPASPPPPSRACTPRQPSSRHLIHERSPHLPIHRTQRHDQHPLLHLCGRAVRCGLVRQGLPGRDALRRLVLLFHCLYPEGRVRRHEDEDCAGFHRAAQIGCAARIED